MLFSRNRRPAARTAPAEYRARLEVRRALSAAAPARPRPVAPIAVTATTPQTW